MRLVYCGATPSYAEHISSSICIGIKETTKHQRVNFDLRQQSMLKLFPVEVAPPQMTHYVGEPAEGGRAPRALHTYIEPSFSPVPGPWLPPGPSLDPLAVHYIHTVLTYVGVYFRLQARMLEGQIS